MGEKRADLVNKTRETTGFEETQKVGREFASIINRGDILLLTGELGSGKTTFIQGLAAGLGIEGNIISPTFLIVKEYEAVTPVSDFYHVDLYRVEDENDIPALGLLDVMGGNNSIVAVEWPEKLGKYKPERYISLSFTYTNDEKRSITIEEHR